jgi:hypothetical protein
VTLGEIAAVLWRHIVAVVAVIAAAFTVGFGLARAPVAYQESGTMYFHMPFAAWQSNLSKQQESPQGDAGFVAVLSILVMSSHGQWQVRSAGATANFDVAPVNLGSLEYPDYSDPYLTVTTSGTDPGLVRTSFAAVTRVLGNDLAALQAQAGVPAGHRLKAYFSGVPSPQASPAGSGPRMYGGLAVLAVVAIFAVVILLERRRPRSAAARRPTAPGSVIASIPARLALRDGRRHEDVNGSS